MLTVAMRRSATAAATAVIADEINVSGDQGLVPPDARGTDSLTLCTDERNLDNQSVCFVSTPLRDLTRLDFLVGRCRNCSAFRLTHFNTSFLESNATRLMFQRVLPGPTT
jgi:hypothetical protein